ncbi:hypothetical protein FIBSPDRAFT_872919, partial [Athelia psychrophila]
KPPAPWERPPHALAVHPTCPSHRAFSASAYAAGPGDAFPTAHLNHGYANHSSAFSLSYPEGPNGAASAGLGYSSSSASPIIGVGWGIEGAGSPHGDRGRGRGRTHTHTATQLGRHDPEGSGSGHL